VELSYIVIAQWHQATSFFYHFIFTPDQSPFQTLRKPYGQRTVEWALDSIMTTLSRAIFSPSSSSKPEDHMVFHL